MCVAMLFTGRLTAAMFGQDLCFQNMLFLTIGLLALRPMPAEVLDEAGVPDRAPDSMGAAHGIWPERDIRPGHA
jgi:hypothetical protein